MKNKNTKTNLSGYLVERRYGDSILEILDPGLVSLFMSFKFFHILKRISWNEIEVNGTEIVQQLHMEKAFCGKK